MASVNLADADSTAPAPIHPSPIRPTTHEGSQTPPPDDGATAYDSSPPLPERIRPRQGSLARKRTIEEMYEKNEAPKTSPRAAKHLQRSATIAINPESRGQHLRSNPFGPSTENAHTSFTKEIQDYKEQLDQEFQNFEQSLADRDPSADLEDLDWDSFEEQYNQEIHACNTAEREIMDEFNARFAVPRPTLIRVSTLANVRSNSCCTCRSPAIMKPNELSRGTFL